MRLRVQSLPWWANSFVTVLAPAVVLSILLGAVGEAIVVRIVVEYVLHVAGEILPIVPGWVTLLVHVVGIVSTFLMAWRIIPPPRGVSRSVYAFVSTFMYVMFWQVQPLSMSVTQLAEWIHNLATYIGTMTIGHAAFTTLIAGVAAQVVELYLSLVVAQFVPVIAVIFIVLTFFLAVIVLYFISGVATGLIYKTATFLAKALHGHPGWFMLLLLFVCDVLTMTCVYTMLLMFAIFLGTLATLVIVMATSKLPWTAISQIASGVVAIIVAIFLSSLIRFILSETSIFLGNTFGIRPPVPLIVIGIVLAVSSIIVTVGLAPMILLALGMYILGTMMNIFAVCVGGIPRRARQLQALVGTLVTLFIIAHLVGPVHDAVIGLVHWFLSIVQHH